MIVLIQIHYIATEYHSKTLQRGEFQLKGRKPEVVAYKFWRWIKREIPVDIELEKVICDGEDITELVRELEKASLE